MATARALDGSGERQRLGGYRAGDLLREVVAVAGAGGTTVVVDRLVGGGDERLVGHLAADEPAANAVVLARAYLADPTRGRARHLRPADLFAVPPEAATPAGRVAQSWQRLLEAGGGRFGIGLSGREVRWVASRRGTLRVVSLRTVVGALERYEPALAITRAALRDLEATQGRCCERLAGELWRLERSPYVLNRRLREAVLQAVASGDLSFSEIALRCGRAKRDSEGAICGETTWLARRIGLAGEYASVAPSPWIHHRVLALIARFGLGVDPHQVESD